MMSPFCGISAAAADEAVHKCFLNTVFLTEGLLAFFELIRVFEEDAQTMSEMVASAVSSYIDLEYLDTSYETLSVLIRKMLVWMMEEHAAITHEDTAQDIDDVLDSVIGGTEKCALDVGMRNLVVFCSFYGTLIWQRAIVRSAFYVNYCMLIKLNF